MVIKNDKDGKSIVACLNVPDVCLVCCTPVVALDGSVLWNGDTNIILHQECAEILALGLAHDSIELKRYLRSDR